MQHKQSLCKWVWF